MREVDSPALSTVLRALGIGSPSTATAPVTFDDDNLQQVLDVTPMVRRGGSLAASIGGEGLFGLNMSTTHAGAGAEIVTVDPYALLSSAFGETDPTKFDIWLLMGCSSTTAGTGAFTAAEVAVFYPDSQVFSGGATAMLVNRAIWDEEVSPFTGSAIHSFNATPNLEYTFSFNMRIPPGGTIRYRTEATGAAAYRFDAAMGVFPASTGQDGAI